MFLLTAKRDSDERCNRITIEGIFGVLTLGNRRSADLCVRQSCEIFDPSFERFSSPDAWGNSVPGGKQEER